MISTDEMRQVLREACEVAGSQSAWAKANGLSSAYVSDVLAGRREPGKSIAQVFGYEPVTMYKELPRKGRRPPSEPASMRWVKAKD